MNTCSTKATLKEVQNFFLSMVVVMQIYCLNQIVTKPGNPPHLASDPPKEWPATPPEQSTPTEPSPS